MTRKLVKPKKTPKTDIQKHMEFMAKIKNAGWGIFVNG